MVRWLLAIWSLVLLPFLNPVYISGSSWFTYCWSLAWRILSLWNEHNCVVVWAFFGIAFLWDWNENWPFPVLWPLLSFPNLLTYCGVSTCPGQANTFPKISMFSIKIQSEGEIIPVILVVKMYLYCKELLTSSTGLMTWDKDGHVGQSARPVHLWFVHWVSNSEPTPWPANPETLTLWPFTENICYLLFQRVRE